MRRTYCAPPTYLAQKGVHPFGKGLLLRRLSLVLQLLDSALLEALLHSRGHREAGAMEAACLAVITLQLHLVPQLEPFEQATKGRDSKWVEPRTPTCGRLMCAVVYVECCRPDVCTTIAELPPNALSHCLLKSWHIEGHYAPLRRERDPNLN